jgi:hypothetical protein
MPDRVDIEAVRRANPLIETIERLTGQQGKVVNHGWSLFFCPFHDDGAKRSFNVNPEKDHWRCFGDCNTGGDVVDFVMKFRGVDFLTAVKELGAPELSQEDRERWAAKRHADELEAAERMARRRELWRSAQPWEALHKQLGAEQRQWYLRRGIPDDWQDFWCLGWTPQLWDLGPAFSIPFWNTEHECQTMQYRLQVESDRGKYRFEPDLGSAAFIARPDMPLTGQILVVEGAFKAMVAHIKGTHCKLQVIGLPSKVSDGGICERLRQAERVWILGDPDAWDRPKNAPKDWLPAPIRWAQCIGQQARIIRHPTKIDDALLAGWLTSQGLRDILRLQARTAESYLESY